MSYVGDAATITTRASLSRAKASTIKTVISASLLLVWILLMVPVRLLAGLFYSRASTVVPRYFHRGVRRLFNIDLELEGELCTDEPTIYVCNHISYLDVFVLGSILPGSFIAKSEVAGWPLFGKLARLQNTLFFERNARRVRDQIQVMKDHLVHRGNLIFFPEGTSTPGDHVEPFRSSLLQAADGEAGVPIQPVTVAYVKYEQQMMTQAERDAYAWYLPMTFLPHFLNGLGLGKSTAKIIFHKPVMITDFESRKACAEYCEEQVRRGLMRALEG